MSMDDVDQCLGLFILNHQTIRKTSIYFFSLVCVRRYNVLYGTMYFRLDLPFFEVVSIMGLLTLCSAFAAFA